jgi:hypothetical protein
VTSFVKTEAKLKHVLALETSEVTIAKLSEDENNRTRLGESEGEVRVVVVQCPRDRECSPELTDTPVVSEETGSLEGLILSKKVFIRDPEISIVAEAVVELLKPLGSPLFGAVACTW